MTALIFSTTPDDAVVAMDTVTAFSNPSHVSKFVYLPHIRTIVATTGASNLMWAWLFGLGAHADEATGIEAIGETAEIELPNIYAALPIRDGLTTTLYQIGFSEHTDEVVVHAFRSINGFALERVPHGTYMKPPLEVSPEPRDTFESNLEALMRAQKEQEDSKPPHKRCYIGGQGVAIQLTRQGATIRNLFDLG